jgi:hypothetical protein
MYEGAQEIFDYLSINRSKPETDYIDHLWNAFVALDNTENSARQKPCVKYLDRDLCE